MRIKPHEIISLKLFSSQPYSRPGSKNLIEAAKNGNLKKVDELLKENRMLVFDFDYVNQTALHWAAKRNYPEIIQLLISYG
jgi:ankyrin repeat protein